MPSLDRSKSTDILGTSGSPGTGVTVVGPGQSLAVVVSPNRAEPRLYTWELAFPGAPPASLTLNIEGSLDNVNWYVLDTSSALTRQSIFSLVVWR